MRPGTPEPVGVETKQSSLVTQNKAQRKNNHFGIYEHLAVNLAYSSSRMASNRLTREQVEDIYRTNKLSVPFETTKVDDIIEIVNHFIYTTTMCWDKHRRAGTRVKPMSFLLSNTFSVRSLRHIVILRIDLLSWK